jgi:hypothetical protein
MGRTVFPQALVVGSSPTQPNWISQPRTSRETPLEAAARPIKLRANKAGKVSTKEVKKDKTATKTLKNSNKQQHVVGAGLFLITRAAGLG